MQWVQRIETSDRIVLSKSQWDRLELCFLALFRLPEEAIADIREEMQYKIEFYSDLALYDARRLPALESPSVQVKVNPATTRPPFYLPIVED